MDTCTFVQEAQKSATFPLAFRFDGTFRIASAPFTIWNTAAPERCRPSRPKPSWTRNLL